MGFLALELWPYLLGALLLGLVTGWLSGCAPRRAGERPVADGAPEEARP